MNHSLSAMVAATLNELGIPAPSALIHTFALQEGRLVAEKLRYDGGYAIWIVGSEVVQFYDQGGRLLRSVAVASAKVTAAA